MNDFYKKILFYMGMLYAPITPLVIFISGSSYLIFNFEIIPIHTLETIILIWAIIMILITLYATFGLPEDERLKWW